MKRIILQNNRYTKVSDIDYDGISKYRWRLSKSGYVCMCVCVYKCMCVCLYVYMYVWV